MKTKTLLAAAAVTAGAFAPSAMADGRNPGSVLIYPVHRSGEGNFSIVSVTNINTQPQTPISFGGSTQTHWEYAVATKNPLNPFRPFGCTILNANEFLTPADTFSINTDCHIQVFGSAPDGYLTISAEDPSFNSVAWDFDYLIGSELVVNGSGGMYSVNAIPFEGRPGAKQGEGMPTDLNGNGQLDFDGIEYEGVPDILYMDSFIAVSGSQLALLNLTGGPNDINTIQFAGWNDDERVLSATLEFNCWFDQRLSKVAPVFKQSYLENIQNAADELDIDCTGVGRFETGWSSIQSINVRTTGGLPIAGDGAILGCITAGPRSSFDGGHLLWESKTKQFNGSAHNP